MQNARQTNLHELREHTPVDLRVAVSPPSEKCVDLVDEHNARAKSARERLLIRFAMVIRTDNAMQRRKSERTKVAWISFSDSECHFDFILLAWIWSIRAPLSFASARHTIVLPVPYNPS